MKHTQHGYLYLYFCEGEIRPQIKMWDYLRNFPLCAFGPGLAMGYGFFKSEVVMVSCMQIQSLGRKVPFSRFCLGIPSASLSCGFFGSSLLSTSSPMFILIASLWNALLLHCLVLEFHPFSSQVSAVCLHTLVLLDSSSQGTPRMFI